MACKTSPPNYRPMTKSSSSGVSSPRGFATSRSPVLSRPNGFLNWPMPARLRAGSGIHLRVLLTARWFPIDADSRMRSAPGSPT